MTLKDMTRRSHWLGEALRNDDGQAPALTGDARHDVCIVGGGFTGLWTALRLKEAEPALDVAIVEKDYCGAGASGRNGGFVLSFWAKFLSLKKICGEEEAVRLAKLSAENVAEIGRFCEMNGIDSHFRPDGWLWAATSAAQRGAWQGTIDAAEKWQLHPFEEWSPEEVGRRTGTDRHLAGVFEPSAATVQPARLARGLRRVALERGVRLYEETPLTRLETGRPPRVVTPRGTISARKVVLAMNAWGIRFAALRKGIVVVSSDIVVTEPAPERLRRIGYDDGLCISDGRTLVHYLRTTKDGRIAFGKGGMNGLLPFGGRVGEMFDGPSRLREGVEQWFRWTYPALAGVRIEASWTGPIDRSKTGLPHFHHLEGAPDIFYGIGYSGNGVGPSALGGRILASLVLEKKDEWARCGLVRPILRDFPPEPIRYVGGRLVQKAVAAKDRAEDAGRAPGPVVSYLARFAPAGLSPFKGQKAGLEEKHG
jgi:putative aminophosphonate oxidoreductase